MRKATGRNTGLCSQNRAPPPAQGCFLAGSDPKAPFLARDSQSKLSVSEKPLIITLAGKTRWQARQHSSRWRPTGAKGCSAHCACAISSACSKAMCACLCVHQLLSGSVHSRWDTVQRSTALSDHGAMSMSCLVPSVIFLLILAAELQAVWQGLDSVHLLRGQ